MQQLRRGERRNLQDFALGDTLFLTVQTGLRGGDVSLLGLNEQGRLSDERNFIYYNQPNGAGGAVSAQVAPSGETGRFTLDLRRLPSDIARFAVVISHDDQPLSRVQGGTLLISGGPSDPARASYSFGGHEFGTGLAATIAEVYRRAGQWRIGLLGEEYRGGLEGLLKHYGADVQAAPAPAAVPPARPTPAQSPTPVRQPAPVPPAPTRTVIASAPSPTEAPGRPLTLQKNQTISLEKTAGKSLDRVMFGLGWDPAREGLDIDLDASCVLLTGLELDEDSVEYGNIVYFGNLESEDGSVTHTEDNLTGEGDGDDEQILVQLTRVPLEITTLVLTINSYQGHPFTSVRNAFCRVVHQSTGRELARYNLSEGSTTTGMLMAKLQRDSGGWHMTALGEPAKGEVIHEGPMMRAVLRHARH